MARVRADVERGDHWLARQRLASRLATCGYDAELLAELGDISLAMHDAFSAGRFYLCSNAEGPQVDAAVAAFVEQLRRDPHQVVSQLPGAVRKLSVDQLSLAGARRVRDLNLAAVLTNFDEARRKSFQYPKTPIWVVSVAVVGGFLGIIGLVAGFLTISSWLFGR